MQFLTLFAAFLAISPVFAFPRFSPNSRRAPSGNGAKCFPAGRRLERSAPYSPKFKYTGAVLDGKPGKGTGGGLVPLPGDNDHVFRKPEPGAYRGPCPGLNVVANYGFLSRDGVATLEELIAAAQNVFNFGWDLSVALSAIGVGVDGDVDTGLLSIGPDASCTGEAIGGGLNQHDFFEGDASLTRNDLLLGPEHDDGSFNATLFKWMTDFAAFYSTPENPIYNKAAIGAYKSARWEHSRVHNGDFHFGPGQLITYGAAAIVFQTLGGNGEPDYNSISHIFGAEKNANGGYSFNNEEKLPPGWRTREKAWRLREVADEVRDLYTAYPKVFGTQANFNWTTSARQLGENPTSTEILCSLYDSVTSRGQPGPNPLPYKRLKYITDHVNQIFIDEGCPVLVPEPY